jgi:transposase
VRQKYMYRNLIARRMQKSGAGFSTSLSRYEWFCCRIDDDDRAEQCIFQYAMLHNRAVWTTIW